MAYLAHSKRARVDSYDNSQNGNTSGVDHKDRLVLRIHELYLNQDFSDIEFVIGPDVVPGHKCIICVTPVWRQLLHEKTSVELEDTPLTPFKELLRYIYTGRLSYDNYEPQMITEIRQLAEKYEMWDLVEPLQEQEEFKINVDNIIEVFAGTPVDSMTGKACLAFIAHNTQDVLYLDDFYELDVPHIQTVFNRDDLNTTEQVIFEAIKRYVTGSSASDKDKRAVLSTVRLALLPFEYMWTTLRKFCDETHLLSIEELVTVSAAKAKLTVQQPEIRGRAICLPNSVDVIACDRKRSHLSTQILRGKLGDVGVDADTLELDLGLHYLLNGLGVMISGSFKTRYAFKVESSVDNIQWNTLYDFTKYHTSNKLDLNFDPKVIRFLKFSEAISFPDWAEKKKETKVVRKWSNIVAAYTEPTGLVKLRDNLLASKYLFSQMNCDFTYKSWYKKNGKTFYVCALNDPIVCVLSQPVWMDCISLYLPDGRQEEETKVVRSSRRGKVEEEETVEENGEEDEREFNFTVEVTSEREATFKGKDKSWQMVGNFKDQSRKGDVDVVFEPRVVNAFRVTGTRIVNPKPKEKDFAVEIRI